MNNMVQGFLMLMGRGIIMCNDRYIEMYGLSPEIVKPDDRFSRSYNTGPRPGC